MKPNEDDMHDSLINNVQRTPSMNSLGDAHTPSESPEASSSESSTGGDWESGEFKSDELVEHWPKQRTFSNSKSKNKKLANFKSSNTNTANTAITTSTSSIPAKLSQQHQFKAKSNSIKIFNNTSNLSSSSNSNSVSVNVNINNNVNVSKLDSKKMRWLWNMRSDPDFHETIVKTVNIQAPSKLTGRQSSDSLDIYSTICDKELSVSGSPYKSPSDCIPSLLSEQTKIRSRTNSFTKRHHHTKLSPSHSMHVHANKCSPHDKSCTSTSSTSSTSESCDPVLIVAKPIESQAIGFNVVDTRSEKKNAAGKLQCDTQSSTSGQSSIMLLSSDTDNSKKKSENDSNDTFILEKLIKRSKSSEFHVEIPASASSSPSLSIANEQNSFFDFSISQNIDHMVKHSNMIIEPDSSMDTSASNSPTDENAECSLPSSAQKIDQRKSKHNLPPMRSVSTSSATDCDEVDSKIVTLSWSNDVTLMTNNKQLTSDLCGSNDLTARSSTSSNSTTSSSSSSSLTNIKRNRPPFSFRDIRNELRSVMRQNRNNSK